MNCIFLTFLTVYYYYYYFTDLVVDVKTVKYYYLESIRLLWYNIVLYLMYGLEKNLKEKCEVGNFLVCSLVDDSGMCFYTFFNKKMQK